MTNKSSTSLPAVDQQVMSNPADYEMTEKDKTLVSQGKAFWILGSALAKMKLICKTFRTTELMVFLLAQKNNPYQIVDILIPKEQFANSSAVLTSGEVVLRANREARTMGCIIVGAAHSHALMSIFSSSTDLEYMRQLNEEEVGWSSQIPTMSLGRLIALTKTDAALCSTAQIFEAQFDAYPLVSVEIGTNRGDISPEDLNVSLTCREPLQVSSFQTFNSDGDWFMPVYKISRCPWCRSVTREETETDVVINIIGEEALGHHERQEFLAQAEQRVPRHGVPYYQYHQPQYGYNSWKTNKPDWLSRPQYSSPSGYADSAKLTDFVIWRHGQSHRISAEIMEEASFRCRALAEAMGWEQSEKKTLNGEDAEAEQTTELPNVLETGKEDFNEDK